MDRSYLSDQQVVAASREFVCARLITFEDSGEARLMKRIWGGRKLVNTAFALMDPSGNKALTRTGRSPSMVFDEAESMAKKMRAVAKRYPAKGKVKAKDLGLPILEDVRVALNVTECDSQQLVVLRGNKKQIQQLRKQLTDLCWSEQLVGRFLYAIADDQTDWSKLDGAAKAAKNGVLIVRSDTYGLTGEVIASIAAKDAKKKLEKALLTAAANHKPAAVDTRRVRRAGIRKGVKWQPEIPTSKSR